MTARQRLLGGVLRAFGGANLESFDERLLLQKRVYLLATVGVDLGYIHSWYIRGPYSAALTRDAFAIDREEGLVRSGLSGSLPAVIAEKIEDLKGALGTYWTNAEQLELMASVVFLNKTGSMASIADRLKKLKPRYKATEVNKAMVFARERGWIR